VCVGWGGKTNWHLRECMLIFFCKHVLYIKILKWLMLWNMFIEMLDKKKAECRQRSGKIHSKQFTDKKKYRATRNLLKTRVKFRSTEDGFLSNVSLIFTLWKLTNVSLRSEFCVVLSITTSCLLDGACLIHVMYASLRIVVSNTCYRLCKLAILW
jgi:hypothetical protein